jgi:hypothetical protein
MKGEKLMRSFKVLGPLALVLGLVGAAPAAAGGDAGPPLYPSVVNVRLVRAEAALQRAVEYVDTAQADKAIAQLTIVRSQMRKAWTGAKYVIDNAPPPVAGDGAFGRASGGAVGGFVYADQYKTALAVLSLQHDVTTTSVGLVDGAKATLLSSLSTTVFAALNARDASIAYIKSKDVAPPVAGDGAVGRASGAPIVAGWATTMTQLPAQLDDEIQEMEVMLGSMTSTSGGAKVLRAAEFQDTKTERTVNQYWPPLPPGD